MRRLFWTSLTFKIARKLARCVFEASKDVFLNKFFVLWRISTKHSKSWRIRSKKHVFYRPRSIHRRTALHVGAPPPSRTSEKKRKVVNTRPHLVDKPEQLELWVPLSFHSCFTSCRKIARSWSFFTLHIISEAQKRSFLISFGCVKLRSTTRHEKAWHTKLLREINALICKLKRSQTASSEGLEGFLSHLGEV